MTLYMYFVTGDVAGVAPNEKTSRSAAIGWIDFVSILFQGYKPFKKNVFNILPGI